MGETVYHIQQTEDKMEREEKKREGEGEEEKGQERGMWTNKLDFIMSALSFAVGMGNLWRFPYLCYRNGGGAFLIPYIIMVVFAGFPLIYLEFALGQFGSLGVVSIWKAVPIFQGIGWTMFAISTISCIYYNMLVAYSVFYTVVSFAKDVPWKDCDNSWNTPNCGGVANQVAYRNCTVSMNGTWYNNTCFLPTDPMFDDVTKLTNNSQSFVPVPATDEYFHRFMLDISETIDDIGGVRWQLALCLLFCWILVFLGLSTGVKSLGKAAYVTSTFPYLILMILLVRGLTLEGSREGVLYYITPQWHRLASAEVWGDAAVQVFFSLSTCWGGLITLASYNNFNNNIFRDSLIVVIGDALTSIFGGVVIFAILGYMSHELGTPIDKVATQGAGLAFIVYPQAVTRLPISPLWAVLFMLMLINLGIGTQFTLVTTTHTTLLDVFSKHLRKGRRPLLLLLALCMVGFLIGMTICTRGGMYVLQLMDSYAPSYGLLVVGLAETLALSWVYGIDRWYKDIEQMLGRKPSRFFSIVWSYITPAFIVAVLLFTFIDFKRSSYGEYTFPVWSDVFGWLIVLVEVGCIPAVAIYRVATSQCKGSIIARIRYESKPRSDWGPALERNRQKSASNEDWRIPLRKRGKNDEKTETKDGFSDMELQDANQPMV